MGERRVGQRTAGNALRSRLEYLMYSVCRSQCVRPSVRPSVRPFVLPFVRSSVRLSVRRSAHSPARPPVPPSVRSSVHPSVRPSARLSVRPSVRLFVRRSNGPSARFSLRPSLSPFVPLLPEVCDTSGQQRTAFKLETEGGQEREIESACTRGTPRGGRVPRRAPLDGVKIKQTNGVEGSRRRRLYYETLLAASTFIASGRVVRVVVPIGFLFGITSIVLSCRLGTYWRAVTDSRTEERTDGQADGRTDGWTDGRKEGRTDGRMDGWTDGRTN